MKRILQNLAMLLAVQALAFSAFAQQQASAGADAGGTIVSPLKVQEQKDLNFGAVVRGNGTVVVTPNDPLTHAVMDPGGIAPTGGVTLLGPSSALHSYDGSIQGYGQARFRVSGQPGYAFHITLPVDDPPVFQITSDFPVVGLNVTDFTSFPVGSGTLGTSGPNLGVGFFNVGATLHVTSTTPSDIYLAKFNVTVSYE